MASPAYNIYYGKYPDATPNEIPNAHIKSVAGLQFRIEPGKPAKPKVDSVNFTLENLNTDGSERYDDTFFDDASRSEAEGGTFPNQLFFSVEMYTGAKFVGVFKSKSYGKYRATVQIEVKSLLELASDNNLSMLESIEISGCQFLGRADCESDDPANEFPCMVDLNGDNVKQEVLAFALETTSWNSNPIDHGGENPSGSTDPGFQQTQVLNYFYGDAGFHRDDIENVNCYIKIGDQTILTTIKLVQEVIDAGLEYHVNSIVLYVYQSKNGNVEKNNRTILERGRFFSDGKDLQVDQNYTVTIIGPDRGYSKDVIIGLDNWPDTQFMAGCPVAELNGKLHILESSVSYDVFNLFETSVQTVTDHLLSRYNQGATTLLDTGDIDSTAVHAFWGDLGMFGWIGQAASEVLVNMSMMAGSYLFVNEDGTITFQDRLAADGLPAQLPSGAFEVKLRDIRPLGAQDEGNGFDSFTITYKDRVEIDNVQSDAQKTVAVDSSGVRNKPALRNTDIPVETYRTQNLGVPVSDNGLPLFRRSPDDANFGASGLDLSDFIPTAPAQAQAFAKSWTYPTELWKIEWDMDRYPDARIGRYFWVQWPGVKRVYFIRQITHDGDSLTHKMEVQKVGVCNG